MERDALMPVNRKYPLRELTSACEYYQGKNGRMITFEYILIAGVNDGLDQVKPLAQLAKRLNAKVNLIPFNPWPGAPYECSTPERVRRFSEIVFAAGISAPVRTPRGRDIDAACGQLRTAAEKKSRAVRDREAEIAA